MCPLNWKTKNITGCFKFVMHDLQSCAISKTSNFSSMSESTKLYWWLFLKWLNSSYSKFVVKQIAASCSVFDKSQTFIIIKRNAIIQQHFSPAVRSEWRESNAKGITRKIIIQIMPNEIILYNLSLAPANRIDRVRRKYW